jgi:hypothetical protein
MGISRAVAGLFLFLFLGCGGSGLVDDGAGRLPDGAIAGDPHANTRDEDAYAAGENPDTDGGMSSTPCDPVNCSEGCCLPDGGCSMGISDPDSCGSNGEACTTCPSGYSCSTGGCLRTIMAFPCGPSNCNGCCLPFPRLPDAGPPDGATNTDSCFMGTQDSFCGHGGEVCTRCAPVHDNGQCVPEDGGAGGYCEIGTCGPDNCPGCCAQGGVCALGIQDFACGSGGAACEDCTANDGLCAGTEPGSQLQGLAYCNYLLP